MVCKCREGSALDEELEVSHGEVYCQELAVEGAVYLVSRLRNCLLKNPRHL